MYQRLIPTLLLKGNRLAKGVRFSNHRDAGNPSTTARAHNNQGADEITVLDISASTEGRGPDVKTISLIADECFIPLTVGGGIANEYDANACMNVGADKICLNTTAKDNPSLVEKLAHRFGSQAIVIGIDIFYHEDKSLVLFDHRTGKVIEGSDPITWIKESVNLGVGEIRLMSVNREGSLAGFDLEIYRSVRNLVSVPIVLEGGAGGLTDLEAAYNDGVDGIGLGSMLVFSDSNLVKIRQYLSTKGHNVRPLN